MARKSLGIAAVVSLLTLLGPTAAMGHISSLTVDDKAQLGANGAAVTLTGTMRCDTGEEGSVSVIVSQSHAKESVFGSGSAQTLCDGTSHTWSVTAIALDEGTFKTGPAAARVDGFSQIPFDPANPQQQHFDSEVVNTTVHIRR